MNQKIQKKIVIQKIQEKIKPKTTTYKQHMEKDNDN